MDTLKNKNVEAQKVDNAPENSGTAYSQATSWDNETENEESLDLDEKNVLAQNPKDDPEPGIREDESEDGEPILDEEDLEENDLTEEDLEDIEWEEPTEGTTKKSSASGLTETDLTV